ncbi:MAG: hypothetical protein WBE50_06425, partial [Methyloceanibacter sp.]
MRRIARLRDSGNLAWSVAATIISLIAIAPVVTIFVLALQSSGDSWSHLVANVLPGARRRRPPRFRGLDEGTACHASASALQLQYTRHPGFHARLA